MTINTTLPPVEVEQHELPRTETFAYPGNIICQHGGTGKDIRHRLNKARNATVSLKATWKSAQYSTKTKFKIYQSCVQSTFLYGSQSGRMTEYDMLRLSTFYTTSFRRKKKSTETSGEGTSPARNSSTKATRKTCRS